MMAGKLQKSGTVKADTVVIVSGSLIVRGGMMVGIATSKATFQVVRSSAEDPALLTQLLNQDHVIIEVLAGIRRGVMGHPLPTTLTDGAYKVELRQAAKMTLDVNAGVPGNPYNNDLVRITDDSEPSITVKTNLPAAQDAEVRRLFLLSPLRSWIK